MTQFTSPLDNIEIASPCSADWNAMIGNHQRRYCGECKLNVYNLSGMSRVEAEKLIMNTEDRVCVRYFRREDGTIITEDCPVGLQIIRKRMSRFWTTTVSMLITFFSAIGLTTFMTQSSVEESSRNSAFSEQKEIKRQDFSNANANKKAEEKQNAVMGKISLNAPNAQKNIKF